MDLNAELENMSPEEQAEMAALLQSSPSMAPPSVSTSTTTAEQSPARPRSAVVQQQPGSIMMDAEQQAAHMAGMQVGAAGVVAAALVGFAVYKLGMWIFGSAAVASLPSKSSRADSVSNEADIRKYLAELERLKED